MWLYLTNAQAGEKKKTRNNKKTRWVEEKPLIEMGARGDTNSDLIIAQVKYTCHCIAQLHDIVQTLSLFYL